ncbi:DUF1295-domain-containing protein [Choiromyces venosus 120613-1]|uniref:DUF1295-domain-containing protein n=1 Tax=Choiromyces venosus 120613-1 TaxID=1336337 RepID=A0A3N4JNI6_9PEZI|nr:DUF1295-domain-containing protein [Choiromyces venosus 120613-1]
MAASLPLPTVSSISEITDFSKTVTPFLHQLSISHIKPLLTGQVPVKEWYLSTNPLITAAHFALAMTLIVLAASEINRNYSQVDRLWSLLPTIYIGHYTLFAHMNGLDTQRLDTLTAFSLLWSVRLTYNYWRKGGYNIGSEDYRWEIIQKAIPGWAFTLLNIVFISFLQNVLLCMITAPAYLHLISSTLPTVPAWSLSDLILSRALLITLVAEAFADQQQWAYQNAKKSYLATGTVPRGYTKADLDRGFVVTGLWSFCRHPNFTAEQTIWVLVYQWSCLVCDELWNWTGLGAVGYLALFQGSVWLTERITAGKYKEYKEYQKMVNRFVPGMGAFTGASEFEKKKN